MNISAIAPYLSTQLFHAQSIYRGLTLYSGCHFGEHFSYEVRLSIVRGYMQSCQASLLGKHNIEKKTFIFRIIKCNLCP